MKTTLRIGFPLMASAIGSVIGFGIGSAIGNRIIKSKTQFTTKDALAIGAGTMIPLALRFTGLPATVFGCVLSALMSSFLKNDTQPTEVEKSVQEQKKRVETQKKFVTYEFNQVFNLTVQSAEGRTKIQTFRQETAFPLLNDYISQANPEQKIEIIETIFKNFKNKNDKLFNSSEIWTGLLKTLSKQTDIPDTKKISLAVADNKKDNDTKLECTFGQLKEFINAFSSDVNLGNIDVDEKKAWHNWRFRQIKQTRPYITEQQVQEIFDTSNPSQENDKNLKETYGYEKYEQTDDFKGKLKDIDTKTEKIIDEFLNGLKANKPYLKVLNHNNTHYTSFIINRISQDNFQVIHINSSDLGTYQTADFNKKEIKKYLNTFINHGSGNSLDTKYQNFFSDGIAFQIPSNEITGLKDNNYFTPYTQDINACHHISVINLLKFFIEKCPVS